METKLRTCTKCKAKKCLDDFWKRNTGKYGRQSVCKVCRKLGLDRVKVILIQTKWRCKEHGIKFDITEEDIAIPKRCPVLGVPLKFGVGKSGPNSPSLDRKNPRKGYVRGNVWIISNKANMMKQNASPKELVKFAEWAIKTYGA